MNKITDNITDIQQQLQDCASLFNHQSPKLIAVSKTYPSNYIIEAHQAGQLAFGENYLQELANKASELKDLNLEWHFIGNIQSNKSKIIAEHAHYLHTLTKLSHAKRINDQRNESLPVLKVLIEVNISQEPNKHGLDNFAEILHLANELKQLPRLELCGLMGMASETNDHELILQQFLQLKDYQNKLNQQGFNLAELSMGMSGDYQLAIQAGATMVRIGSKIFGKRNYDN